ncbi:MAG: dihydrofolate reductase [Bdellovibrio sp.]|nr:dihydrofolate reductase [Bdellovibrio sp.]
MGVVSYYVAASIDGFISRTDENLDWLNHIPEHNSFTILGGGKEDLFEYHNFYKTVDVMLMGRRTFDVTMGFAEYPYPDKKAFVFTRNLDLRPEVKHAVEIVSRDPGEVAAMLKKETKNRIWLVGGGSLASELMRAGQIDEIILTIIPIILGSGIKLFKEGEFEADFERQEVVALSNGLTQIRFLKKQTK